MNINFIKTENEKLTDDMGKLCRLYINEMGERECKEELGFYGVGLGNVPYLLNSQCKHYSGIYYFV